MMDEVLIDGDRSHEWWIRVALEYVPDEVLNKEGGNIAILGLGAVGGCRVPVHYRERELVVLSDWIFPPGAKSEDDETARFFICTVLHEIAHAVLHHKSPRMDELTPEEYQAQEDEADALAVEWFNEHGKQKPIEATEFRDLVNRFEPLFDEIEKFKGEWHGK